MEDLERCWVLDGVWSLLVRESAAGWSIEVADRESAVGKRPMRWTDRSGAFGAPSDEIRLEGRSGTWGLRVYAESRVVAAAEVPGGRLSLPPGWWQSTNEECADRPVGFGEQGSSVRDLERCERRGWESWVLREMAGAAQRVSFSVVRSWHRADASYGDTPLLHRMAPVEGEAVLRERLREGRGVRVALDCEGLVEDSDTEDQLADGFLFAHQAFGARWLCWNAPPSTKVVRALERAHMDAQGELFGVWLAGSAILPARAPWRGLGPILRANESDPDCYVWER